MSRYTAFPACRRWICPDVGEQEREAVVEALFELPTIPLKLESPRDVLKLMLPHCGYGSQRLLLRHRAGAGRRLIDVVKQRQVRSLGSLIADFEHQGLGERLLHIEAPLLGLGIGQISG